MRFMLACFGGDRAISVDAQKTLEVSSREHKSGTCSGLLQPVSSAIILYALKKIPRQPPIRGQNHGDKDATGDSERSVQRRCRAITAQRCSSS